MVVRIVSAILLAGLFLSGIAPAAEPEKPASHMVREIQGWKVHVDDRLLTGGGAERGTLALGLLEGQLRTISLVLPEDKRKRVQEVPIWLDLTHGELHSPQYHPSAEWLAGHGYSKDLARGVHIPEAAYFVGARFQRTQPSGVLHELAHAYHDQVLTWEHPEIKAAWERFVAGGRYKSVLHVDGREHPHYALTNEKEFFAEMTESYFGQNDFFPFNSGELQREEKPIYDLLAKIWGPLP